MSISKIRGTKSALGKQQQQQRENADIPKSDGDSTTNDEKIQYKIAYNKKFNGNVATTTTTTTTMATATMPLTNITVNNNNIGVTTTSTATATTTSKYAAPIANILSNGQQQQQIQQQQQTYLPQTSLLKIKPFVPSLNTRLRRPIGRSYSTLSSTYLKRTTTSTTNHTNIITTTTTTTSSTTTTTTTNGIWCSNNNNNNNINNNKDNIIVGSGIDRTSNISNSTSISNSTATALPKAANIRQIGNLRRQPIKVITHQRSKSTSSSAASITNRPATAANINGNHTAPTTTIIGNNNSTNNGGAIVTPQPNGICRITRLPKEQEKLPDRINYDRRGLTAIPIFENETNLRLLSLQHNLINVFHIPKETNEQMNETLSTLSTLSTTTTTEIKSSGVNKQQNNIIGYNIMMNGVSSTSTPPQTNGNNNNNNHHHHHNRHLNSINRNNCMIARGPMTLSPPMESNGGGGGSLLTATSPSPPLQPQPLSATTSCQLLKRNNLLQQLHFNAQQHNQQQNQQHHHPHQQQQQQQQTHYRFAMKKSKSFITNYTRHNVKRSAPRPLLNKTEAKMLVLLGRTNLKSFDSSGSGITTTDSISTTTAVTTTTTTTSELDEDDYYEQQLEIKNKQLRASYGVIFEHLVFLDLYDNQIERIANLDGLPTLSVLLLGKNRITDISGLNSLRQTLRVLDLHGNKITTISNKINCLQGLKSLNLAGNQIRQINQNDFNGLVNLKELNLKRNRIRRINGFQHLIALERLWLCHNDLHKVDDMSSIAKALNLQEVTIENNPVSLAGDCVSFLVSYLPNLQSLSQMPITEQVRRAALAWRKNKELSELNHAQHSTDVFNNIRREEVISNARTNWELLRSQQTMQTALRNQRSPKPRELAKISESNETVVGYEDLQEYIKLPPIQQQQQQQQQQQPKQPELHLNEQPEIVRHQSGSSNSSLGPNVDSSSSTYSSDNEETPKKQPQQQQQQQCRIKKLQQYQQHSTKKSNTNKSKKKYENTSKESSQNDEEIVDDCNTTITKPLSPINKNEIDIQLTNQLTANGKTTMPTQPTQPQAIEQFNTAFNGTMLTTNTPVSTPTPNNNNNNNNNIAQSRSPTPVTTITGNSNILCLGYATHQTNNGPTSPITTNQMAINNNTISTSSTTLTATTTSTTTTTTTTTTTSTCKRYMRGSLMRSHVVVSGIGSAGSMSGSIGGCGGKLKTIARNNIHTHTHQNFVTSIGNCGQTTSNCIVSIAAPIGNTNNNAISPTTTTKPSSSQNSTNVVLNSNSPTAVTTTTNTTTTTTTTSSSSLSSKPVATEREREQGGDYLIEICGRYLNIYGQGALRFIDKQWNATKANDVHTLNFSYINFNNIVAILGRIKVRFPHAENFVFRETNISCLGQLNALAELQGIVSLFIDPEGNAITTKDLWRQYAIYRLSHWGLKLLNGIEISVTEVDEANVMYAGLSDLVMWSMPDVMLHPLLARLRLDETCTASKMSPKEWLMKTENKSLRLVVGKEALQWKKPSISNSNNNNNNNNTNNNNNNHTNNTTSTLNNTNVTLNNTTAISSNNFNHQLHHHQQQQQQHHHSLLSGNGNGQQQQQQYATNINNDIDDGHRGPTILNISNVAALSTRERGKLHFTVMMENTCNAIEKLHKLETLWPSLLLDIVRNTLLDYSQLDAYLRNLIIEIMK